MTRLGAAVVGLGVGAEHLAAYGRHPACDVVAVCDRLPDRLEDAADRHPGVRVTKDFEDLIDDPAVDIVSIASFDDDHFGQTVAALEAGKHVFVEKPLCRTLDELRKVKRAWEAAPGTRLRSNLVLRAAPLFRWLHDRIRSGDLGRLYAFDGDYLYGRIEKITNGWRGDVEDYSVILGGGIHLADLMLWMAGERPTEVTATGNRICTEGTAFAYEDFAAATFRFPSGLIGRITANFGCVHPHQHVVRAFGTEGTLISDDRGPRFHRDRDSGTEADPLSLSTLPASKGALVPGFVDDILAGGGEGTEAREFDLIAACVAADEALRTGRPMKVEYP